MRSDFEFLASLMKAFFEQTHIQTAFNLISSKPIHGWEVWLQVEFACFLQSNDTINWRREELIEYDLRFKNTKKFLRADFIFRKNQWKPDYYVAIEFKQHNNAKNCISNMQKDMWRVERMKQSSINLRSYWVIGIFQKNKTLNLQDLIEKAISPHNYDYDPRVTAIASIPGTIFQYCIF